MTLDDALGVPRDETRYPAARPGSLPTRAAIPHSRARAAALRVTLLSLDLEADFHGDLEFLNLVFRDAAALFDDLEPVHVTDGMCRLGDRGPYSFGKTDGRCAYDLGDLVCSRQGALLDSVAGSIISCGGSANPAGRWETRFPAAGGLGRRGFVHFVRSGKLPPGSFLSAFIGVHRRPIWGFRIRVGPGKKHIWPPINAE